MRTLWDNPAMGIEAAVKDSCVMLCPLALMPLASVSPAIPKKGSNSDPPFVCQMLQLFCY
jgi:hypothetical protein